VVDKVLQRCEVSPHNSRLSPHSEDAHSLRDEASLCSAYQQLGTTPLIRSGLVLVHALAATQRSLSRFITPRTRQLRGTQEILSKNIGRLPIVQRLSGVEPSFGRSIDSQYEFTGWIPKDVRTPLTTNPHHLTNISECRNSLPYRSTNCRIKVCLLRNLKETMGSPS
jgi:hypothetical protein